MALTKGVNSYVTVEEADVYFTTRLDVAAWDNASSEHKAAALVTATSLLESKRWSGYAVSDSQSLCFPREGFYFDPRLGYEVEYNSAEVPARIITATQELAYHLLNNDGLLDDTGRVSDLQLGSVTLSKIQAPNVIPSAVTRLIQPLLDVSNNGWWRAN